MYLDKITKDSDAKVNDLITEEPYRNVIDSFDDPDDIAFAPERIKIYSYSIGANQPIVFRHYDRTFDNAKTFSTPPMIKPSYCRVYIIAQHNTRMMINNNVYIPQFGSVVLIKSGDIYQPIFFATDRIDYYEINFPKEFFQLVGNESPFHEMFYSKDSRSIISPTQDAAMGIFHILKKILRTIEKKQPHDQFLIWSHLIQLSSYICHMISNKSELRDSQIITHSLHKAMDYISSNYLTITGIGDVAKHCHVSSSYLCRIFKKQINSTPIEFVNQRKIHHAKFLLKKGYTVTEACYSSGFNNYPYFIRLFKKITGQTPGDYAKKDFTTE